MVIIKGSVVELMNFRIQQEENSSRLYLAMSLWLNLNGYIGASKLWKKYSTEESIHSNWAYDYLVNLNILPEVPALEKPSMDFKGLPQIVALSYKHEVEITNQCQSLAEKALAEGDYMTLELAQKYLKEQVEELDKTQQWLDQLNAFGDSKEALRLLDNKMEESI